MRGERGVRGEREDNSVLLLIIVLFQTSADWFASYHTFDEFTAYLANITSSFPSLVKYPLLFFYYIFHSSLIPNIKSTIGQSIQGRNIDAYVITGTASGTKKKIILTGYLSSLSLLLFFLLPSLLPSFTCLPFFVSSY